MDQKAGKRVIVIALRHGISNSWAVVFFNNNISYATIATIETI